MDTFGQNINNEMNLTVMNNTGLSSRPLLTSTFIAPGSYFDISIWIT